MFYTMSKEVRVSRNLANEFAARRLRESGAQLLSCAANMHDLRPAVDGIMARIEQAGACLQAEQKLVVLVGETHSVASHRLLQMQLIARLHERMAAQGKEIAAGFELPHNFATQKMAGMKIPPLSPLMQDCLKRHMGSSGLIRAFLDDNPLTEAPRSKSFLLHNIGARDISTRFHDVAVSYQAEGMDGCAGIPCFDQSDTATRNLTATLSPPEDVICESALGMKLRNDFMVCNVSAHIQAVKPDIYMHIAGSAHILGDHGEELAYEDSLHKQLLDRGYAVLSVVLLEGGVMGMDHWQTSVLSRRAQEEGLPDTVLVTDMARQRFYSHEPDKECQFIKSVMLQSAAHDVARPMHQKSWKRQVLAFKNEVPRWIAGARESCRNEILARNMAVPF